MFFNFFGLSSLESEFAELTKFSNDFVNRGISILGFILAGYAIFSSVTDKNLQEALAKKNEPKSGINYLKHTHALFVKILIELIILILIVFSLQVVFDIEILRSLVQYDYLNDLQMTKVIATIKAVVYSLFVYVLLLCKSFVYNVYHIIMISIRWSLENPIKANNCHSDDN
jgi:hypothetical protein